MAGLDVLELKVTIGDKTPIYVTNNDPNVTAVAKEKPDVGPPWYDKERQYYGVTISTIDWNLPGWCQTWVIACEIMITGCSSLIW